MPRVGGTSGTESQEFGASFNYENKFDAVSVKASIGQWRRRGAAADSTNSTHFGARIGFGDITIGGSFLNVGNEDSGLEGTANSDENEVYDIGILFKPKGYSVGLHYMHGEKPMSNATAGDDAKSILSLGAAYDLGPGVAAVGSLFWVDYEDELTADTNNNTGWAVVGGIKVSF
jgi:predicted porin